MPKMRTNRAAAKRFRTTGTGKVKRSHSTASHLMSKKSSQRKRELRKSGQVTSADMQRVKRLLGV